MTKRLEAVLTQNEQAAVREFVSRVVEQVPADIEYVTLFGSKARADARADADLDILLVVDSDDWRIRHTVSSIAADVGLSHDVFIDPRVLSVDRWQQMQRQQFTFYKNVIRDGITLMPAA